MKVVDRGWRYRRRATPPGLLVLASATVLAVGVAGAVAAGVAASRWGHDPDNEVIVGLAYVFGVPWALAGLFAAGVLVRALPDLWRRQVVEGEVSLSRVERRDDNGVIERYSLRVAIDDGRSERIVAYPLGDVRPGRLSGTAFDYLKSGDVARLTVAPGYGHVFSVEPLHDRDGRPLPAIGMLPPAPPGAPVTAEDLVATYALVARSVEEGGDGTVRWWAFELLGGLNARLVVYALPGPGEALAAHLGATGPRRSRGVPIDLTRYASGLAVAERDGVAVGLLRSGLMDEPLRLYPCDARLADLALRRLSPAGSRGRR